MMGNIYAVTVIVNIIQNCYDTNMIWGGLLLKLKIIVFS